ncbi:hypothetical protein WICMUC_004034 [Wickerhamomyces mucosus]|uniref:Uncharacterized protein n=1 Tax=Wickerhamomyces mucosus TaxID=1378264 RepID=A0A9P8PIQ4_9ASCO|nr:hypothetical protein WICMUC_004034 [Wickerhamomyces mucosus]
MNLHQIIEAIGGIGGDLDDEKDAEGNDLDIPIPSFETVDSDEEENDISKTEVDNDRALLNNKFIPGLEELVIGQPRDLNDVYSLGFDKIIEDKYTLQGLKDFSILAFKLADEPFDVLPPKHDEE